MPSPVGHALGAVAIGWLLSPQLDNRRLALARPRLTLTPVAAAGLTYAAAGVAPDLDLLAGTHSTYTHSVGAAAVVFICGWARFRRARPAAALAAAWSTHVLFDWLGYDTTVPVGIMALWPVTDAFYLSDWTIFDSISRRYWLPDQFIWGNLRAVAREIVLLGPLAAASAWLAARRDARRSESSRLA